MEGLTVPIYTSKQSDTETRSPRGRHSGSNAVYKHLGSQGTSQLPALIDGERRRQATKRGEALYKVRNTVPMG